MILKSYHIAKYRKKWNYSLIVLRNKKILLFKETQMQSEVFLGGTRVRTEPPHSP